MSLTSLLNQFILLASALLLLSLSANAASNRLERERQEMAKIESEIHQMLTDDFQNLKDFSAAEIEARKNLFNSKLEILNKLKSKRQALVVIDSSPTPEAAQKPEPVNAQVNFENNNSKKSSERNQVPIYGLGVKKPESLEEILNYLTISKDHAWVAMETMNAKQNEIVTAEYFDDRIYLNSSEPNPYPKTEEEQARNRELFMEAVSKGVLNNNFSHSLTSLRKFFEFTRKWEGIVTYSENLDDENAEFFEDAQGEDLDDKLREFKKLALFKWLDTKPFKEDVQDFLSNNRKKLKGWPGLDDEYSDYSDLIEYLNGVEPLLIKYGYVKSLEDLSWFRKHTPITARLKFEELKELLPQINSKNFYENFQASSTEGRYLLLERAFELNYFTDAQKINDYLWHLYMSIKNHRDSIKNKRGLLPESLRNKKSFDGNEATSFDNQELIEEIRKYEPILEREVNMMRWLATKYRSNFKRMNPNSKEMESFKKYTDTSYFTLPTVRPKELPKVNHRAPFVGNCSELFQR